MEAALLRHEASGQNFTCITDEHDSTRPMLPSRHGNDPLDVVSERHDVDPRGEVRGAMTAVQL